MLEIVSNSYEGHECTRCDEKGRLIPTGAEGAARGAERAARVKSRPAFRLEEQAARLAAKLRELGIDPTKL